MHVLVSGGAGFIGSHSCRMLLQRGHEVTVLDDLSSGRRENLSRGAKLIVADVRSAASTEAIQRSRPDAILHLAAQMDVRKSVADPLFDASVNVLGTLNLLESARRNGVGRFVFASSGGAIYGEQEVFPAPESHARRPLSPYGVSKLCGEEYLAHYALTAGMSTLALRYANVYGPAQNPHGEAGVVAIFLHRMLAGEEPIINGDGAQTRDYVYVEDVARANCAAIESRVGGAINIGTGRETPLNDLASRLAAAAGWRKPLPHGPPRPGEQRRSCVDVSAARESLGWEATVVLEEGVTHTATWFRAQAS